MYVYVPDCMYVDHVHAGAAENRRRYCTPGTTVTSEREPLNVGARN